MCDIGNSYVVETDISTFVSIIGSIRRYISVWDLVRAISSKTTKSSTAVSEASILEFNNSLGNDSAWMDSN